MILTYRGVSYEASPKYLQTKKIISFAKYRGHYYQLNAAINKSKKSSDCWTYRGIKSELKSSSTIA